MNFSPGYVPNTDADRQQMLATIGVASVDDLFHDVPADFRFPRLNLPEPVSEYEILQELQALSSEDADADTAPCFLGAGAYHHFVPSIVDAIISRSEFYTAYTPYQPEVSQGTLQAIFEYQSMICALTGMDVSNASHYDGATAVAEAVIMALNIGRLKRKTVLFSRDVNPQYRAVAQTYTQGMEVSFSGFAPGIDLDALEALIDHSSAAVIVQNPDFLGRLTSPARLRQLADAAHAGGAVLIVVADPISLGMFKAPGSYDADIVCGEGQSLGNPLNFGGPYLGFFACKSDHVRRSAGRIIGETVDVDGERGFVLTLSTREQHIRRDKATSNICTNQGLVALSAAVYMSALGKHGLRRVAELCYHKAHYAAQQIATQTGFEVWQDKPFFQEFIVRSALPVAAVNRYLFDEYGIIGGYDLSQDYPELGNAMLLCVTETLSKRDIDALVAALAEIEDAGAAQAAPIPQDDTLPELDVESEQMDVVIEAMEAIQ